MLHSSFPLGQFLELAEGLMTLPEELGDAVRNTLISKVPILDKNKKFEFNEDLKAGLRGANALKKYGMKIKCDLDVFKPIPDILLQSRYSTMTELVIYIYQCLVWSYDTKYKATLKDFNILTKKFEDLEKKVNSITHLLEYSYKKVLKRALTDKNIKFVDETFVTMNNIFEKSQIFTKKSSKVFTNYIFIASSRSESLVQHLISVLNIMASQKRPLLVNADISRIIQCLTNLLNDLNPKFIMFISSLSHFAPYDIITSIYQFLPNVLYAKITELSKPKKRPKVNEKFEIKETKVQDFVFFDVPFNHSIFDTQRFSQFFSQKDTILFDYVSIVSNGLISAENVYRDIFFASALRIFKLKDLDHLQIFSCVLTIIFENISIDYPIPSAYSVVAESLVVTSKQNIFEYIDPDIDYARNILFHLVCTNHPELVIDLFRRFSQTPYLVAEFLCRIRQCDISKVNFGLMADEEDILILTNSLKQLMPLDNYAKDCIFYFLLFLATEPNSSPLCIASKSFVSMLMYLLFNRSSQKDILNTIQNSLAIYKTLPNFLHFATALNNVVDACIGAKVGESEEYVKLALAIFDVVQEVILNQSTLLKHFVHILDKYITLCALYQDLFEIIDFIIVLSKSSDDFYIAPYQSSTLLPIFQKQYRTDPPEDVFTKICKIVTFGNVHSDIIREIRNTMNIPFALACFGLSPKLNHFLNYFLDLTEQRRSSLSQLCASGVSRYILTFFTGNGEAVDVNFDQFKFKIFIQKEMYEKCFQLLKRILVYKCDHNEIALITKALYGQFSVEILEVIEESVAACIGSRYRKFAVGYQPTQVVLEAPIVDLLNDTFSLEFSLNIDSSTAHFAEDHFNIISFVDEANNTLEFKLYHGQIYAINDNYMTRNVVCVTRSLPNNVIHEFPLIIKRNDKTLNITRLMENTLPMVSEIFYVPMTGTNIRVIVGGTPKQSYQETIFGYVFNVRIHSETYQSIPEINNAKPLYDFGKISENDPELLLMNSTLPINILEGMIQSSFADILVSFFNKEFNTNHNIIFSILKMILPVASGSPQFDTIVKFLVDVPSMLTYFTFIEIVRIFEEIQNDDELKNNFFKYLVGNIELWSESVDFGLVLDYNIRYLSKAAVFDVEYCLRMYLVLFYAGAKYESNKEIEEKYINFIYSVLHDIDSRGVDFLFENIFESRFCKDLNRRLQILDFTIAANFTLEETKRKNILKKIIRNLSTNIEESAKLIQLITKIAGKQTYVYLYAANKSIISLNIQKEIFDKLYEKFADFPLITLLLPVLSLSLTDIEKSSTISALLYTAMHSPFAEDEIFGDDLWFIIPIVVVSKIPNLFGTFAQYLAMMAKRCSNKKQCVVNTFLALRMFELAVPSLHKIVIEYVEACIDLFFDELPNILIFMLFSCVFIWPNVQPMSIRLREEFMNSPFAENVTPEVDLPKFSCPDNADDILNFLSSPFSELNVRFKIRFDDTLQWIDNSSMKVFEKILNMEQPISDVTPQLQVILSKYCKGQRPEHEINPSMQVSIIYVIENALTSFKSLFNDFATRAFHLFGANLVELQSI